MAEKQVQAVFSSVNPWMPSHLLKDGEVQTATNIDFSLMNGALVPRRGAFKTNKVGTLPITQMYHNYNVAQAITAGPMYVTDTSSKLFRIDAPGTPSSAVTTLVSDVDGVSAFPPAITSYKQYTIIAGGTGLYKDDGTNTTEWIKQTPAAPSVSINTLAAKNLAYNGFTVTQGTLVSGTTTCTFVTDAITNAATVVDTFTASADLTVNGTNTIGNNGIQFVTLAFSDPAAITKIMWDFSIGDANFTNYWHSEVTVGTGGFLVDNSTPQNLVDNNLALTSNPITVQQRQDIISQFSNYDFSAQAVTLSLSQNLGPWAVPIPNFSFYGAGNITNPWSQIYALRISVSGTNTCTITAKDPALYGAQNYSLTDTENGYYYWQTLATTNTDGLKIDEGAPSTPAGPFRMQNANTTVINTFTATGSHGVNAIITYRQGGYTTDAYAINTHSYTGVTTFTDTTNDITALALNYPMPRGLMQKSQLGSYVSSMSQSVQDRIFFASGNLIRWTLPGQVGSVSANSFQEISSLGDPIQGILAWNPGLIIVNRSSVYEMSGTDFEAGQFTVQRTGSRRGSLAVKTIIRTPYGIPLLNVDGLTMYQPGYNTDADISWFTEKYGDVFKGGDTTDPAYVKGQRVPALDKGSIHLACAAYRSSKLFLALPCGPTSAARYPNTVFVLDFELKQAWWYTYPYNITTLLTDDRLPYLWAGTDDGTLMIIEFSTTDQNTSGTSVPIVWTARTKQWTNDTVTVLENLAVDSEGTGIIAKAYYDNTTNPTVSTLSNTVRGWSIPPLNGTFVNGVAFDFNGTSSGTSTTLGTLAAVYGMRFDQLMEPAVTRYWRTDYDEHNWTADKLWDVAYYDIEVMSTGTVTAVTFVDGTAKITTAFTGTASRFIYEVAFPAETYGRVAYTTYTSGSTPYLKHWDTRYDARNEPAKINYYRTDIESLEENICEAFDTDINPNGTVFGTVFIDNVATLTATITGTNRQSFTNDIPVTSYPNNTYGRTIYVTYTGTAFKHYKSWFHLKREPDRWTEFISDKVTGDEQEVKVFKPELNCLGNTVLATTFLDGVATSTHTITGSVRKQYTLSLPVESYGRTIHAAYRANSGRFKHYTTDWDGKPEPPRITLYRTGPYPYESDHYLKTWQPRLDPLNGTVTGTLFVNDVALTTQTFTGNRQQWFTVGIDLTTNYALETGSRWEAVYSCSTGQFKHYETKMDSDTDPFRKIYYSFNYRKLGGASQIDLAKFWSLEVNTPDTTNNAPIVGTYWWDIDNVNFSTGTLTLEEGNQFYDRISFPPGARGRLFQFRMYAPATVKIGHVNLDLAEEGVKGLNRVGHGAKPDDANN